MGDIADDCFDRAMDEYYEIGVQHEWGEEDLLSEKLEQALQRRELARKRKQKEEEAPF